MKLIKAYIRYRKTEHVFKALKNAGFTNITFVECEGTGQYSDQEQEHFSDKYPFATSFKVIKLEILVPDDRLPKVIEIIRTNGRTGYQGDGMIIVSPVDEVYKIKNDEMGTNAI